MPRLHPKAWIAKTQTQTRFCPLLLTTSLDGTAVVVVVSGNVSVLAAGVATAGGCWPDTWRGRVSLCGPKRLLRGGLVPLVAGLCIPACIAVASGCLLVCNWAFNLFEGVAK